MHQPSLQCPVVLVHQVFLQIFSQVICDLSMWLYHRCYLWINWNLQTCLLLNHKKVCVYILSHAKANNSLDDFWLTFTRLTFVDSHNFWSIASTVTPEWTKSFTCTPPQWHSKTVFCFTTINSECTMPLNILSILTHFIKQFTICIMALLSEFQVLHIFSKCLTFPHLLHDCVCFNAGHSESFFMCSTSDSLLFILVLNSIHWWGLIFWQLFRIFSLHDLGLFIWKFCCLGSAAFFRSLCETHLSIILSLNISSVPPPMLQYFPSHEGVR